MIMVFCSLATLSAQGCKRGARREPQPVAAETIAAPTATAALPAPTAAPQAPAADPLWPRWLPTIAGVQRRMAMRDAFEGNSTNSGLVTLINARQALERQGFALSQTSTRSEYGTQKFVFTATRGAEFSRVEIVGHRPDYSMVLVQTGAFARTMMARRR
jgi:hypothetical protein